jgi:3',5'-cyclic AMP phosphodiesterase CpdA
MKRRTFLRVTGIGALASGIRAEGAQTPAAAAAAAPPVEPLRLRTGPYLQNPAPDAMTVMWMTTTPCVGWVEYGPTELLGQRASGDADGLRQANVAIHRVRLAGLEPGRRYFYRVRCKPITMYQPYKIVYGPEIESPLYEFTTINPSADRVRFLVFNDLHDNVKLWRELHALVADELAIDFVFLNGDVTDYLQDEKQMVEHFLDVCTQAFATRAPFLYARGNHETRGAFSRHMRDYLDLPADRYYYGLNWGPLRLTVLDTGEDKLDTTPVYAGLCDFEAYRQTQRQWLASEIATGDFCSARWRVLIHHIPPYYNQPDSDEHPDNHCAVSTRKMWWPLLADAKVDLYLGGHTHSPTIKGPDPAMGHAFPMVIGGGPRKGIGTVMLVDADRQRIKVKMLKDDGSVVGEVTV